MEGRRERVEPLDCAHDLSSLGGEVEAVARGDRSMQQCPTGGQIICTPIRAPNANAVAERWVGTVRRECLDHLLIVGRPHLVHVLRSYVEHYHQHRPHRSLGLGTPYPRCVVTQQV